MPRISDTTALHSAFREIAQQLQDELNAAGIPLYPYETVRSPFRQAELYAIGRQTGVRGKTVTRAQPWQSFHQYGLAVDFVFHVDNKWSWNEPKYGMWKELTVRAEHLGLRSLSFEKPHVEFQYPLSKLTSGYFPTGGGDRWQSWFEEQVEQWGTHSRNVGGINHPAAPPLTYLLTEQRPPLDEIGHTT